MSTLQFHLSWNNGAERIQLPVNPESIRITSGRQHEDVNVTQIGEYTIIGGEKLREFSFSSFFPSGYHPSYCEYAGFLPPWELVKQIERWVATGRPIRFTLTGQIYEGDTFYEIINAAVTVRDFTYEERGGAVGDVYYDLALKEYRFIEFRRVSDVSAIGATTATTEAARPDTSEKKSEYTVASGDSLFKIASKADIYADGDQWRKIYDANKSVIGANPNVIKVGQKLVIPR